MIEIRCTAAQKKRLIQAWRGPEGCFWPWARRWCIYDPDAKCTKCYEKRIKWIIVTPKKRSAP